MSILRHRPLSFACATAFAIWAPMSSAQAAEVRLYEHCNYAGYSIPLGSGAHDLGGLRISGLVNDDISSVQVPPGMQVTLYEHAGYQGRAITLTSDAPCLVHAGFNDIMSSAVVQQAGVPQGYSAPVPVPMNDPVRVEPYSTVAGWNIGVARDAGTNAFIGCVLQTFDNDGELLIGFDVTPKILKIGVPAAGRSGIISGAVQADSLPWTAVDFESDGRVATANFSEATWPFTNVDDGRVFRVNLAGRLMEWDIAHSTQAFDQFEACIDTNSPQPGGYATMASPPPALTAYDIGSARFAQGEFRHLGGGQWVELGDNGGQFNFVELSRNADYVYLDDPSRNIQIRIGVPGRMIDVDQGQGWTPLYPVTQLHRQGLHPCGFFHSGMSP